MRETLKVFRTQPEVMKGYPYLLQIRAGCLIATFRV